jgi:hypothetical protein
MDANKIPTLAFTDIDYSLIVYILAALTIGGGGTYYILKSERMIAAAGFFLASIAVFIYFGLRWFDKFKLRQFLSGTVDPTSSWPPVINYCPDFLSLVQKGTEYYCVDTTGVTGLVPYTQSSTIADPQNNTPVNNYLRLSKTTGTGGATKPKTGQDYLASDFSSGALLGATWEGIYDGRNAANIAPPFPAVTTPAAAGGGSA